VPASYHALPTEPWPRSHTWVFRMLLPRGLRELTRFGYDVFISYSRSDGLKYAQALYVALNERGLAPFIDVVGTSPGQSTPASVLRRLKRSSMLVLVCSAGAAASRNIAEEVEAFAPTGRNIVVIDLEGALSGAGFKGHLGGLPVQAETMSALALGKPSAPVVDAVMSAVDFVRRSSRLHRAVIGAVVLGAAVLAVSAIVSTWIVVDAERTARRARTGTLLEQDGAEAARLLEARPLEGLLAAMKAVDGLQTLEGKDLSFVSDLQDLPAVSPVSALVNGVGAVRERNRLAHFSDTYLEVVFSPDGRLLAAHSKSGDDLIGLFDADSGREVATLKAGHRQLMSLSFSPTGDLIASGGLDALRLYSARTGDVVRTLTEDKGYFHRVRFSPDGQFVVAAHGNTVRRWDVQSLSEMPALQSDVGPVSLLAFSPDGKVLAAGGEAGSITLWGFDSGLRIHRLRGHTNQIEGLVFTPDGTRLFSSALDDRVIAWTVATGADVLLASSGGYAPLTISPDGNFLAQSGSDGAPARVFDLDSPRGTKIVRSFENAGKVAFDVTGQVLLVAHSDGLVGGYRVAGWSDGTGRGWKALWLARAHDRYFDIGVAPTGRRFATGGEDGLLKLWDASSTEIPTVLPAGEGTWLRGPEVSPDGRFAAQVQGGRNLILVDLASGRVTSPLQTERPIDSVLFSADGRLLVVVEGAGESARTRTLDARTGRELPKSASDGSGSAPLLDAEGRHLASLVGGKVAVVDLVSAHTRATWTPTTPVELFALSADAETLVVKGSTDRKLRAVRLRSGTEVPIDAGDEGRIAFRDPHWILSTSGNGATRLWDARSGEPVAIGLAGLGVSDLALSRDGGMAVFADPKGIHVWDLCELKERSAFELVDFPVYRMRFDPSGRMLVIDRNGGAKTKLWHIAGQREIRTLSDVGASEFSPDGRLLVARSLQGDQARLVQLVTGREIGTLHARTELAGIRFTPDGKSLLGWSGNGDLHLWPTRLDKWREAGCAWVAEYLALHPDEAFHAVTSIAGKTVTRSVCGAR
jgi:WD40 repeat protein